LPQKKFFFTKMTANSKKGRKIAGFFDFGEKKLKRQTIKPDEVSLC